MAMHNKKNLLILLLWSIPQFCLGIGLDELKPQVDSPASNSVEPKEKAPPSNENGKEAIQQHLEASPAKKDAEKIDPEDNLKNSESIKQPSSLSLKLSEKMYLAMGLGFASIKGPKGEWSTLGNADALIAYQVTEFQENLWQLFLSYRFAPYDVVVRKDHENYRGNIDTHNFGGEIRRKMASLELHFGTELSAQIVHLKQTDQFKPKENLEKNGFALSLGGGVDWRILEKVLIGPRLHLGIGTYTVAQLLCNFGFVF